MIIKFKSSITAVSIDDFYKSSKMPGTCKMFNKYVWNKWSDFIHLDGINCDL